MPTPQTPGAFAQMVKVGQVRLEFLPTKVKHPESTPKDCLAIVSNLCAISSLPQGTLRHLDPRVPNFPPTHRAP